MYKNKIINYLGVDKTEIKYNPDEKVIWLIRPTYNCMIVELKGLNGVQGECFYDNNRYDLDEAHELHHKIGEFIAEAIKEKIEREKNVLLNKN